MYCTVDDIIAAVPRDALLQLTDDEQLGEINSARVTVAIARAEARVDSYVGVKYATPLADPVSRTINEITVDLTIYDLYSRVMDDVPETRNERKRDAIRRLEGIARGTVSLGIDQEPEPREQGSGAETTQDSSSQTFTRDSMEGF